MAWFFYHARVIMKALVRVISGGWGAFTKVLGDEGEIGWQMEVHLKFLAGGRTG